MTTARSDHRKAKMDLMGGLFVSHFILHCLPGHRSWDGDLSETFTQVPIGCNRCIILQDMLSYSVGQPTVQQDEDLRS